MAQDRFINVTVDPNLASKPDRANDKHTKALAGSASGDLTVSYDSAKFTSQSVFRSALMAVIEQAAGMMKP